MGGFGVRAVYHMIGRRIVKVTGSGVKHMAGPGSRTSGGGGFRITMGDGHIMIIVGVGCPARNLRLAARGGGPRIMSHFLAGAITRDSGAPVEIAMVEIAMVRDGWGGVRSLRERRIANAGVTTFAGQ